MPRIYPEVPPVFHPLAARQVLAHLLKLEAEGAVLQRAGHWVVPVDLAPFHEVGDLLLAAVNLARRVGVEADDALRLANRRFRTRFRHVERAYPDHEAMKAAPLDELEGHWQEAKRAE